MAQYRKDNYIFKPSTRKYKKYDAFRKIDGRWQKVASFGDTRYEQFRDKIGHYKFKDHQDLKRKQKYYSRHGKNASFETPKWFSHKYLW